MSQLGNDGVAVKKFFENCSLRSIFASVGIPLLLVSCGGGDMSDIDQYVKEVKSRPSRRIEPLPEVKTFPPYQYISEGLRDPFHLEDLQSVAEEDKDPNTAYSGIRPDFNRNKEELEFHPLDSLRMVGTLTQQSQVWAIIRASDGTVHRVKPGNHLGQNYGEILEVNEAGMQLKEIIPDGRGGWQEREASISLVEVGNP